MVTQVEEMVISRDEVRSVGRVTGVLAVKVT